MNKITFNINNVQENLLYLALSHYHTQLANRALRGDEQAKLLEPYVWDLIRQQIDQSTKEKAGQ